MALEESNGIAVAGGSRRSRPRTHPLTGGPADASADHLEAARSPDPDAVDRALAELRDELGFRTASLYVHGPSGWELHRRQGPERSWHGVLDPSIFEGVDRIAEYTDVRTIPGVGSRLARLGCSSLAIVPLPDGSRILLDSGRTAPGGGWVERLRPYVDLVELLAGPAEGLRSQHETDTLDRLFAACQDALAGPGSTSPELLAASRDALGADELFLLVQRGDGYRVIAPPEERGRSPRDVQLHLDDVASGDADGVRDLTVALGLSSRAVAVSRGRDGAEEEILVAGWAEGPAPSELTMRVAARLVSTTRAALDGRRQSVTTQVDRERTRWE
jgi:hypothetical protein